MAMDDVDTVIWLLLEYVADASCTGCMYCVEMCVSYLGRFAVSSIIDYSH